VLRCPRRSRARDRRRFCRPRRRGNAHDTASRHARAHTRGVANPVHEAGRDATGAIQIWSDARDLIVDPFFVAGPQDIGLGLARPHLAAACCHRLRIRRCNRHSAGTLIGQSVWAMRGSIRFSRSCGRSRRSPGCRSRSRRSATASPRRSSDLHHRGVADHHQHRRGHPQHSAGHRNVAAVLRLNHLDSSTRS